MSDKMAKRIIKRNPFNSYCNLPRSQEQSYGNNSSREDNFRNQVKDALSELEGCVCLLLFINIFSGYKKCSILEKLFWDLVKSGLPFRVRAIEDPVVWNQPCARSREYSPCLSELGLPWVMSHSQI